MHMRKILLAGLVLLLSCSVGIAQDARNGTNSASELLVPVGAQYLHGGGAAAMAKGLEGALWNPAALDQGENSVLATFSRRNYIADIGINFASTGIRFGRLGAVGVSLRSFDIGEIPITDEFNMDGTGGTYTPTVFILGGIYSKQLADRIRVGISGNLINETIGEVEATAFAFDAGVQYDDFLNINSLRIGVAVRNVGTAMQFEGPGLLVDAREPTAERGVTAYKITPMDADIPTVADLGVVYSPITNLNVGLSYLENNYGPNAVKGLATYRIGDYGALRASYKGSITEGGALEDIFSGAAFGATLNLEPLIGTDMALDYGYMPVSYFNNNQIFSLRVGF